MPRISGEANGDGVQAVVLALRILEYLAEQGKAVGVTALAQALGTTKSRIYRHLRTLVQQGYIQQSADTDRYRVGTRLLTLGVSVAENFDLTKAAQGILRELRDALGISCVVSQVEAAGVRVLATIPGKSAIRNRRQAGVAAAFPQLRPGQDRACLRQRSVACRSHQAKSGNDDAANHRRSGGVAEGNPAGTGAGLGHCAERGRHWLEHVSGTDLRCVGRSDRHGRRRRLDPVRPRAAPRTSRSAASLPPAKPSRTRSAIPFTADATPGPNCAGDALITRPRSGHAPKP